MCVCVYVNRRNNNIYYIEMVPGVVRMSTAYSAINE